MIAITPYKAFKSFCPKALVSSLQLMVFLLLSGNSGFCQNIAFNKVFPPNRTSFLQLTDITQDKNGIMWFASNIGLYSYNGYEMISYKNNQMDPNSLAGDILRSVCADNEGNIWIAVQEEGIDKFDPVTGIFTHYKPDPDDPGSLNSDWVNVMIVDHDGILWIGSGEGLSRYDFRTDKFIHYKNIPGDSTSLSYNEVVAIYEDREGTLWIGTGSVYGADQNDFEAGGLNRFDKKTETFRRFKHNPEHQSSLINNKVSAIFEDSKGTLWIGTTGDGLHTMDKSAEIITRHRYDPNQPNKLSRPPLNSSSPTDHIRFIIEDVTGAIWIGTLDAGLNYYNPVTKEVTHFESENNSPGAFTDRATWAAFVSRDGVLWISSLFGTLYRVDPLQSEIPYVELSGQNVLCFYEDRNSTLWWGSHKIFVSGNKHESLIQMINSEFKQAASNFDYVHVIKEDSKGNILIGGGGGLIILNLITNQFTHYVNDPDDDNTLSNNNITSITEDSKNNLWIGTLSGLNRLNPTTREIKRYLIDDEKTDLFGPNYILDVQVDNEDKAWVAFGSGIGLCMLNEASGEFEQYKNVYSVNCLIKDSDGMLWAGTSDGLFYYDLVKKAYIRYTDLYSFNEIATVSNIIEDDNKNLWVSTGSGIIEINALRTDTKKYGTNYGIYSETLNRNASYKDRNGFLYFGDKNGYYKFLPSGIITNSRPPLVTITGFHVSDPAENSVSSQKSEPLSLINEISLSYYQNTFSFDFAVIDYSNPASNQHFFKLENYDEDWRKANADRRAHFFNIQPGRYTFRVKGANSYGVWAEKSIVVVVNPPWWKTWWAYAIYGMLFIGVVLMVDHIQRKRLLAKAHEEAKEKELRQAREIEKAYKDLKATQTQLIQSEKMASLGELTAGIAHEIQNPLNFVNNFSEVNMELMEELKAESSKLKGVRDEALEEELWRDLQENEKKINHHGKRADAIVKSMLQHSRAGSGQKESTDINALADEHLRLSYHGLRAKDKSFNSDFMTELEPALPKIHVIPQDIGRVLLNLSNNAFHAVSEKAKKGIPDYKPQVTVKTRKHDHLVEIRVKDNGDGIPDDIVNKIFQPFFTTKPTGEGTGLGLSLSYDIVTKGHNGTLEVDTTAGLGSEFIVQLPIV